MKLMKRLFLILIGSCILLPLSAQNNLFIQHAKELNKALNKHLKAGNNGLYLEQTGVDKPNPHSWLWPLCAYIQASNELEEIDPAQAYMKPVVDAIDRYWNPAVPYPAYQDYVMKERPSEKFYDDNAWIAIAYLDAYTRTKQQKYLEESKKIYDFLLSGIDTVAGGGLYWKEKDLSTKNTCSNGPTVLVALKLYQVDPQQAYLDKAIELYQWTQKNLQAPDGNYWDNIKLPSLEVDKRKYTYNTGTMLESAVILYRITKDDTYLHEAIRVANAGIAHFFKNDRFPQEYWFNAVMLRAYKALYEVNRNEKWISPFVKDADLIWQKERNKENGLVGNRESYRLIDQAAMIEIYALLAQIEKSK